MTQKRTIVSKHLDAFKSEALKLLRHYSAWKRMMQLDDFHKMNRYDLGDRFISLVCIENDIIVRISKFDDDTKGVHSFRKIEKELPSSFKNKERLKGKIKDYRQLIKDLKQNERNEKLAHLKIGKSDDRYTPQYDLFPAIKMVVEIIDLINGDRVNYHWSDGSHEKYEMREFVGIDKKKTTANKSS